MKRFLAAVIDVILCKIFCSVLYNLVWRALGGVPEMDWQNASMLVKGGIYYGISFASYFIYFVIFDRLCLESTPGKSIIGYKLDVCEEDITWSWIFKHALFKVMAILLYPITILFYISESHMFYDRILGINIEKAEEIPLNPDEIKRMKNKKRLVAFIIDYIVMCLVFIVIQLIINGYIVFCLPRYAVRTVEFLIADGLFMLIFIFLFYFISDKFSQEGGIGKKMVGIRLLADGEKFDTVMVWKHAALKFAVICIWPISLIYYLANGRIFYDKWLKLEVVIDMKGKN